MVQSLEQVRQRLNVYEPDYAILARELGPDAAPHLRTLVTDEDEGIASKAAYLASLLPDQIEIVALAARSSSPVVRVAAAAGAANLSGADVAEPLAGLLDDADVGVRKTALRSATRLQPTELRENVQQMEQADPEDAIRELAREALSHWQEPD
jgi:HEAT repeat protein